MRLRQQYVVALFIPVARRARLAVDSTDTFVNARGSCPARVTSVTVHGPRLVRGSVKLMARFGGVRSTDAALLTLRSLGPTTRKRFVLVAVPSGLSMRTGPVDAPFGTTASSSVKERFVKEAMTPWNVTAVTLCNDVPWSRTTTPVAPTPGVKFVRRGSTRNALVLVIKPPGVATVTGPLRARSGTTAVSSPGCAVNVAAPSLNHTWMAPVKLVPSNCTVSPTTPLVGAISTSQGGKKKRFALVLTPLGPVTVIGPVAAPAGVRAKIFCSAPSVTT